MDQLKATGPEFHGTTYQLADGGWLGVNERGRAYRHEVDERGTRWVLIGEQLNDPRPPPKQHLCSCCGHPAATATSSTTGCCDYARKAMTAGYRWHPDLPIACEMDLAKLVIDEIDSIPTGDRERWRERALYLVLLHINALRSISDLVAGESRDELHRLRGELTALQVRCGLCICGDRTDECCPQCIPGDDALPDVFTQRDILRRFVEKVMRVVASPEFAGVFHCAQLHHCGYRGETWEAEMRDARLALGQLRQEDAVYHVVWPVPNGDAKTMLIKVVHESRATTGAGSFCHRNRQLFMHDGESWLQVEDAELI